MERESLEEKIRNYFVGFLIIFIMGFWTTYEQFEYGIVDFVFHARWAMELNRHILEYMSRYISYPLWHIVVKGIYKFLHFDAGTSVAGATALFHCIAGGSILYAWNGLSEGRARPTGMKVFWTICILAMGPLYAPGFNTSYYLGQGNGNVWHNPTHIAVKGLAVLCFVWIVRLADRKKSHKKWEFVILSVALFLSTLAKPSFVQAMIPGLAVYFILEMLQGDAIKKNIKYFSCIAAAFVPSVILLGWQFVINFLVDTEIHVSEGGGLGIGYGMFLSNWSDNFFCSLLLALAFPLFVLAIDARRLLKDTSVKIVICYGACAWLEAVFLYEKGDRLTDGNWTWGWNLALFVIWMLSVIKYFDVVEDESVPKKRRCIGIACGIPILFFHVLFGAGYFMKVLVLHTT